MLRAVRLAAKLGFTIEPKTRAPIRELATLLDERAAGAAVRRDAQAAAVGPRQRLRAAQLRERRPAPRPAAAARRDPRAAARRALRHASRWRRPTSASAPASRSRRRSCSPRCCGTRCWPRGRRARRRARRRIPALYGAMDDVLDAQTDKLAIPRRFTATMKEIWALQPRFEQRSRPARPTRCSSTRASAPATTSCCCAPRAARCRANWSTGGRRFQDADGDERARACCCPTPAGEQKKRRRRRRTGGRGDEAARRAGRSRRRRSRTERSVAMRAYVGIGANLGDPAGQVRGASRRSARCPTTRARGGSSLYRTAPVGYADQPDFVNAVAAVDTALVRAATCSHALLAHRARRTAASAASGTRRARSTSTCCSTATRRSHDPALTVPHPRMHERAFVLAPLAEIAPDCADSRAAARAAALPRAAGRSAHRAARA